MHGKRQLTFTGRQPNINNVRGLVLREIQKNWKLRPHDWSYVTLQHVRVQISAKFFALHLRESMANNRFLLELESTDNKK
jgi:hypothetical protein